MNPLIKKNQKTIKIAALILLTVFMAWYPYAVKSSIESEFKENLKNAMSKLEGKERETAEEMLTNAEKGKLFADHEHDTGDFMHKDYFGEPWRNWANTYHVWEKARVYYFVLLVILVIRYFVIRRNKAKSQKGDMK